MFDLYSIYVYHMIQVPNIDTLLLSKKVKS